MKALLLRIGIDTGTDGALSPIFDDGSFEYIPLSGQDSSSSETRTYRNTPGIHGLPLSTYLPQKVHDRKLHFDPEFDSFTYGDPTIKRNYLLKLVKGDLLVFYAGLKPFNTDKHKNALYIIGYFTVASVIDFNTLSSDDIEPVRLACKDNSHIKRKDGCKDLVIVRGDPSRSRLLDKAICISEAALGKNGSRYHAVSKEIGSLLGISGSIQRSVPPRFIIDDRYDRLNVLIGISDSDQ